jgi:hypothetical protein
MRGVSRERGLSSSRLSRIFWKKGASERTFWSRITSDRTRPMIPRFSNA